jgi:hypothetical protein
LLGDKPRSFNSTTADLTKGTDAFLATGKKPPKAGGKRKKNPTVWFVILCLLNDLIAQEEKPEVKANAIDSAMGQIIKNSIRQFLESGFNILMRSVKDDIVKERDRVRPEDVVLFFDLCSYLMAFIRHEMEMDSGKEAQQQPRQSANSNVNYHCIATILNSQSVLFTARKLYQFYDEKDVFSLHSTVNFFKELLLIVEKMARSDNERNRSVARNIQSNLFFDDDHLKMFRRLVRDPLTLSQKYESYL